MNHKEAAKVTATFAARGMQLPPIADGESMAAYFKRLKSMIEAPEKKGTAIDANIASGEIEEVKMHRDKNVPDKLTSTKRDIRGGGAVVILDGKELIGETGGEQLPDIEEYEATYEIDPLTAQEFKSDRFTPTASAISRMGGKKQLKEWLVSKFPKGIKTYVEPFGGSFQVLLWKSWRDPIEIINDIDCDLVHFFLWVQRDPERLINYINGFPTHEAMMLGLRAALAAKDLKGIDRAAAFYMAHSTNFNAAARGISYASSPHSLINTRVNPSLLRRVHKRLLGVDIRSTTYDRLLKAAVKEIPGGLFVYLDPPYDETGGYGAIGSNAAGGAGVSKDERAFNFLWSDQVRVAEYCEKIDKVGGRFILTNSATDRIIDLYGSFKRDDGTPRFQVVKRAVYYSLTGTTEKRAAVDEVIVSNFDLKKKQVGKRKVKEVAREQRLLF